jgi:hypothetical protein
MLLIYDTTLYINDNNIQAINTLLYFSFYPFIKLY